MIAVNHHEKVAVRIPDYWHSRTRQKPTPEALANDHGQFDDCLPIHGAEAISAHLAADMARALAEVRGKDSWLTQSRKTGYRYRRVGTSEVFCSMRAVVRRVKELTGKDISVPGAWYLFDAGEPIRGIYFELA